ncbi:chaplin [Streptomyces sp. NPDC059819]|uniref:chaplin n=1 Tax=Streptomyces sp. NPDC059819 TaxID=3346963 RepID=UPI003666BA39
MRQVTRKSLITMAAAGGVIAMGSGAAHADSAAQGSAANSPGALSGNAVQLPVHVPVNVCGNTVNVVGLLSPAFANGCANQGHQGHPGRQGAGADAHGRAVDSPGVGSGNHVQAPIDAPVNLCGNSVSVIGIGNPAFGNDCANDEGGRPGTPQHPGHPQHPGQPHHPGQPQHPGHPGHPGGHQQPCPPHHPGQPGHPGHPGQPQHPGHPGHPGQPQHPGQPGQPGHPVSPVAHQPATPAGPAAPVRAGVPVTHAVTATGPGATAPQLAHTGSQGMGFAVPAAAGLLLGGAVLYRRGRAAQ